MSSDWLTPPVGFPTAAPAGENTLAEIWRNIFPWDDLNAKGPPERFLTLGREVIPTLAVLAAAGGNFPKLLRADHLGSLISAVSGGPVTVTTAAAALADAFVTVLDASLFQHTTQVLIIGGPQSASPGKRVYVGAVDHVTDNQIFTFGRELDVAVGDFVMALPAFTTELFPKEDRELGLITGLKPLTWATAGELAANTLASITTANPDARHRIVIERIVASIVNTGATDHEPFLEIRDTNAAGTILWADAMAVQAVIGVEAHRDLKHMGFAGPADSPLYVAFDGARVNSVESLNVGYWTQVLP